MTRWALTTGGERCECRRLHVTLTLTLTLSQVSVVSVDACMESVLAEWLRQATNVDLNSVPQRENMLAFYAIFTRLM